MKYNKKQLMAGINVELEHSRTIKRVTEGEWSARKVAALIAKDHLREDKNYYTKLRKARL